LARLDIKKGGTVKIRHETDFAAGLMFTLIGLGVAYAASTYQMGTAARMGPGYFPFWLGAVLAVLGAVVVLGSIGVRSAEDKLERPSLKSLTAIIVAIVLFGALLDVLGLVAALFVLVILSSLASHQFSRKTTAITAVVLAVGCSGIFIYGLELPLRLWPSFLGR